MTALGHHQPVNSLAPDRLETAKSGRSTIRICRQWKGTNVQGLLLIILTASMLQALGPRFQFHPPTAVRKIQNR